MHQEREYDVEVVRTSFARRKIRVRATSPSAAAHRACDLAGSLDFGSGYSADYSIAGDPVEVPTVVPNS